MTQGERVKAIRKSCNLTLEKFGEKVGVGKTAISNIENGNRNLTEQMTKSICREFNVDYIWLTTGEGEMFTDNDSDFTSMIDRIMAGENEFHRNLFKKLATATDDELEALKRTIEFFSSTIEKDS